MECHTSSVSVGRRDIGKKADRNTKSGRARGVVEQTDDKHTPATKSFGLRRDHLTAAKSDGVVLSSMLIDTGVSR